MKLQEPNVGGSEMASREKKPLAPSKAKQKANNDSGSPMNEIKSKKGKSLSNPKQQQLARDILEAVATDSQLPPKLEASLPRKKVLRTLKQKQNQRVTKSNSTKSRVTKRVTKNLCSVNSDIRKGAKSKRIKSSEGKNTVKATDNNLKTLENHINDKEVESIGIEGVNRSAKNILRTKKTKAVTKSRAETESEDVLDTNSVAGSSTKSSPKLGRKRRNSENSDPLPKTVKSTKFSGHKKNNIKEKDISTKTEIDNKYTKGRKSAGNIYSGTRTTKLLLDNKSSIDHTIEQVIASMLSDSEIDSQQERGKARRSKKMLVQGNIVPDIEIKKEPDSEDAKITPDGENLEIELVQSAIQLRKRSNASSVSQRSLRNGKLRQSESNASDSELKKNRRLNSDDPVSSEISTDNVADGSIDTESCISELSGNDSQLIVISSTDESKSSEDNSQTASEIENNNHGDKSIEIGPTLRSKKKAKSTEIDTKNDNIKIEYERIVSKNSDEETKKMNNFEQIKNENNLAKFPDKIRSRRNSLTSDMKMTVTRTLEGSKNYPIDELIGHLKRTIVKNIESKIYTSKGYEVPMAEELGIAPLSVESQKLGLEENTDQLLNTEQSTISKNEIKSDNSENSVPKVADTAKEIEKLVMGDIELVETHSQNLQESEPSDAQASSNARDVSEATHTTEKNEDTCNSVDKQDESSEVSNATQQPEKDVEEEEQMNDEKKISPPRKSLRKTDKSSSEKSAKSTTKTPEKSSENCEDISDSLVKSFSEDTLSSDETFEQELMREAANLDFSVACEAITEKQDKVAEVETEDKTKDSATESDEAETLESISKEVERLVAEDPPVLQLETETEKEKTEDNKSSDNEKQEVTPVEAEDSGKSDDQEKVPNVEENAKEESEEIALESVEDSKNKSDSPIPATSDPASNSKQSPVSELCENSVEKEEKEETGDASKDNKCKQDNSADNNNMVNNTSEKEVILCNNSDSTIPQETAETSVEEQKLADDKKKRVLRDRARTKKSEKGTTISPNKERKENVNQKVKTDEETPQKEEDSQNSEEKAQESTTEEVKDAVQNNTELNSSDVDRQSRTRRKEVKKRKNDQSINSKSKRPKREIRKSDQQKEETLLDNEVAKINENNQSFLSKYRNGAECGTKFRGFSEDVSGSLEKCKNTTNNVRSKSENDLVIAKNSRKAACKNRLARNLSENHVTNQTENMDILDADCKLAKTPETSHKDSDETSMSGESSSSVHSTSKILETPEDKAKKESILRVLGLESLEKAAERLNNQKAKKEQCSTGTLKTVIRVHKSRSPLKMVLKQGRGDGDGDSPENFYTIQKELGPNWGDSSSGANRKFSTNHRHSCDEDNEDAPPKDRQSLIIPEKSSSFSIHPGRLCADVCCYCFGKFGSLDTPMHLAQMKSDVRRKKILDNERHLNKDSCLCDACYRHVDRKANTTPTNMQTKPQKQQRQFMYKCSARDCKDAARHHVKRRWLLKIKARIQSEVNIDWESSQHSSMSFCANHYSKIEIFLTCALCSRRLARTNMHLLANAETDELNILLGGVPVVLTAGTFLCKLCRYFTQLQLKYKKVENMGTGHKTFFKGYQKRLLHSHDMTIIESGYEEPKEKDKDKDKRKKTKCATQSKSGTSKSSNGTTNSASEKSTPELIKNGKTNPETENVENRNAKTSSNSGTTTDVVPFVGIENSVEKFKKRKLLNSMHLYASSETTISCDSPNEMVELLAMDKEVTLTRLPKKPKTSNDINPVVQRLGANPSISVRTLFPGEEEMNLHANVEFGNIREVTPQGWEKCATMIQYDRDTKHLWQELQRPYGNQSSFLRHLILLEKYYRSGDLVLAPNASRNAINYSTSVQNRLISYEGPEKMDEPIMEPIEYNNSRQLSGGYLLDMERFSMPSTSTPKSQAPIPSTSTAGSAPKSNPPKILRLNSGVSIIKKPPPNLQRLTLPPSTSTATANGNVRRKEGQKPLVSTGGKVLQLSEPEFKRLQYLKKQKQQQMQTEKQSAISIDPHNLSSQIIKSTTLMKEFQEAPIVTHTPQFQKHLRMQQAMLNRQSRSDFEPLICDVRASSNENSPMQNLLHNLHLPKSIQVMTKTSNQTQMMPRIPKSLTVIPQTITRPADK